MAIEPPPKVVRELDDDGNPTESYSESVDKMLEWMNTVGPSISEALDQIRRSKSDK